MPGFWQSQRVWPILSVNEMCQRCSLAACECDIGRSFCLRIEMMLEPQHVILLCSSCKDRLGELEIS